MNRPLPISIVFSTVLTGCLSSSPALERKQPVFADKSLDEWAQQLKSDGPEGRIEAAKVLAAIGSGAKAALPALIEALEDGQSLVRSDAATALGKIGPDARAAIPALMKNLRRQGDLGGSLEALARIGPAAVPSLLEALGDADEQVRLDAISVLGKIGPDAKEAAPPLRVLLQDRSADVRLTAALALWRVAREPAAVSTLRNALRDKDQFVRQEAAIDLGKIGPDAKDAVPALAGTLQDNWKGARNDAARALGDIGPEAKAAVPDLIAAVQRAGEHGFRQDVLTSLRKMGPATVPPLMDALKNKDDLARGTAAEALGLIGSEAKAAVPLLAEMLKECEGQRCVTAALALWRISQHPASVPALTGALGHEDMVARWGAAEALAEIGPPAKAAVPGLCRALKEGDKFLRRDAARALGRIGPAARAAVDGLAAALKDPEHDVRTAASLASWQVDRQAAAIPSLVRALTSDDKLERESAAEALAVIGPEARPAVPALMEVLKDKDSFVASFVVPDAIRALGKIGPDAGAATPLLIEALKRYDLFDDAADALRAINPGAADRFGGK